MNGRQGGRDERPRWWYLPIFLLLILGIMFLTRDSPPASSVAVSGLSAIEVNGLTCFIVAVSVDSVRQGSSPSKILMEMAAGVAQERDTSLRVSSGVGKLIGEKGQLIGHFLLMQRR